MFQFTTTNVINSSVDSTGKELYVVRTADDKGATLDIKRVGKFCADNITHIYKAGYTEPVKAKAVFDLNDITVEDPKKSKFNLSIYITLTQGSNFSLYANDSWRKGKPFDIEFTWKGSAKDTAENLESMINKYMVNVHGEKMLTITANEGTIEVEAVNEYQRFETAVIQELDEAAYHGLGKYNDILSAEITQGVEGFGTYEYILHNLRMPTTMRTVFMGVNAEENPIPGALYNQYTIHYCVNRGTLGNNAVGDQVTSHTTHVFYVKDDLSTDFETLLKQVAPGGKLEGGSPEDQKALDAEVTEP